MVVEVTDPAEGELLEARARFTPGVRIVLNTGAAAADDVAGVSAELWSTGTGAARIATTALALLSKSGGGSSGTAALLTYGDTPVDLSSLISGTYELRITATTLTGVVASARRSFGADSGPIVRVLSPTTDQAVRGSVVVRLEVTDPFHTDPPTVSATVANIPIPSFTVAGSSYQATVAETVTLPPLSGPQLLAVSAVSATGVASATVAVRFVFDGQGPSITATKPETGALIGGIVTLEAKVTDAAGVDVHSVVAVVAHGTSAFEVRLDQDPNDAKRFSHLFPPICASGATSTATGVAAGSWIPWAATP
jgi:hypothetical protein